MENSTDKLCDHVCDKGGKSAIFADVIDGSPIRGLPSMTSALEGGGG